jgi:U3 small nucleolar RNA-associated protein 14
MALDRYDLALSKLERNNQRDRDDVKYLARTVPFDLAVLKERYEKELRGRLGNPTREDLTMTLWLEAIGEERA